MILNYLGVFQKVNFSKEVKTKLIVDSMISGVDLLTINPNSGQERDPRRHSDIGIFDRKFSKNER